MAALFSASCSEKAPVQVSNEEVICVKAGVMEETNTALPVQYPGILTTKQVIKLSFKTGGIISDIWAQEGSFVKKGQVIASLEMTEISSQVSQAKLALEKAERDLKRVKSLYADTVATLEQLQDATSAYEVALQNNNIAEFNLQYSRITAPANGKIIARLAEEHELAGPGMPVLVFSEQGKEEWIVKAGLSDRDIVRIKEGDRADVVFDAFPGRTFKAFVSQVAEMVDPQSGTFEVEVTVDPQKERLINGLTARISIQPESRQQVTMVPPEALTGADGNRGFVYIVEESDTTAKKVPVTIAFLENQYVAVVEPLNQMGQVITEGASFLEDGTKINISKK
jgi:RND family efflux transporter MFP subunit